MINIKTQKWVRQHTPDADFQGKELMYLHSWHSPRSRRRRKGSTEQSGERIREGIPWERSATALALQGRAGGATGEHWKMFLAVERQIWCPRESQPWAPGSCFQEVEDERTVTWYLGAGTRGECWLGLGCISRVFQGKDAVVSLHEMWAIPEREPSCGWVILDLPESACWRSEGIWAGRDVPLPSASSGTRNGVTSVKVKGPLGWRSQKGTFEKPMAWPHDATQGCFLWPKARLKSKLSHPLTLPPSHGFDLKQQREKEGESGVVENPDRRSQQ